MQIDAGHENAQQKAAEHDMEKGHIMLEQGLSSSPSNGSKDDDPPCSQREGATGLQCLIRKFPHLLIGPAVLFCLVVALGVFGVVYDTQASYEAAQDDAREEALSAADGLATQLTLELRAALSLGAVVKMKPNWSFLESNFQALTDELFRQAGCSRTSRISAQLSMMELELLPFGRVRASAGQSTTRNSTADIFSPELINVFVPQKGMAENGLHIKGPVPLTDSEKQAFTGGYPIFFDDTDEDESWGHPDNITHPTDCPGPPCYNPDTRRKFWGFAAALIDAGPVLRGNNVHLERLLAHKLSYTLQIPPYADPLRKATFVRGGDRPDKVSAIVSVLLPGNSWTLTVCSPEEDKILALRDGLLAMVVVVAFIVSSEA